MTTFRDFSLCKGMPSHIFFPPPDAGPGSLNQARRICAQCPVKEPCLEWALTHMNWREDEGGMWGGTTFRERRKLRRARTRELVDAAPLS